MEPAIKKMNNSRIQQDIECQRLISEMKNVEKFISDFGFISFARDFVSCKNQMFSLQDIIVSVELTSGSIISCCESGCIADANCLLRKYRDDLFFYLYIVVFNSNQNMSTPDRNNMEENISRWIKNGQKDLYIQDVLKAIGSSPQLNSAVRKYEFSMSFEKIGNRLNNFVHSNGYAYYNRNINAYHTCELSKYMKELVDDMKYITVTFLFLLILCSPLSVMATDYTDYLDCGEAPPENSQYWVASFVEQFIMGNISLIDKTCYEYLKENTSMQFDNSVD